MAGTGEHHNGRNCAEADAVDEDRVVGGRYRLVTRIAAGGMGTVWRAIDEVLGRDVAVKLLHAGYAEDDDFRARFRREARAAASISHPGVVPVYDYSSASPPYLVMQLIEGRSLAEELRANGPLPWRRVMTVVEQAARALQAAHDQGVIHRDVKPGNLLVAADGMVKIADFGIAHAADGVAVTASGRLTGTAQYLSPELVRGEKTTPAADLYSLGIVAYACLTGSPPFDDNNDISVAMAHVHDPPAPLPSTIPTAVAEFVESLLAKEPQQRPKTAADVANAASALAQATEGTTRPTPVRRPSFRRPTLSPLRRLYVASIATALAGSAAAALVAWSAPTNVVVPPLTSRQLSAARQVAADANLTTTVRILDMPGSAAGTVIAQSPAAGRSVAARTTLLLTVASGRVRLDPGAVVGRPYAQAVATLTADKLHVDTVTQTTTAASAGTVLAASATGEVPVDALIVLTLAAPPVVIHEPGSAPSANNLAPPAQVASGKGDKKPEKPGKPHHPHG
jgi:serine/threonine-protein kinase